MADQPTISILHPNSAEAQKSFNYTCEHYLRMTGPEFLKLWDSQEITARDVGKLPGLQRVLASMCLIR